MILKQYGSSYQSVEPNFNSAAMTEVGFRRDREFSVSLEDFEAGYEPISESDLAAQASGSVQSEVENEVLANLEAALMAAAQGLDSDQVLVVLNGRDDQPKTRERRQSVVVDGENRYHFHWSVDPPLRVAVFRQR
ncbi:MAG: hypothetical protein OEO23_10910 [Gemmatimonadota bacterium]|nr:hypothetical protein [Gemmatimonadota bacterium]